VRFSLRGEEEETVITLEKEEFMKANGFVDDPESGAWINLTHQVWVSHEAVEDHSLADLSERISMNAPLSEFHFYSNAEIPGPTCIAILKRLNLSDLKPVNHVWRVD
jgi:hypothetical protein